MICQRSECDQWTDKLCIRCRKYRNPGREVCPLFTGKAEAVLSNRLAGYIALVDKLDEYIYFINKASEGAIASALVHGWRCSPKINKQGVSLREEISKLREAI